MFFSSVKEYFVNDALLWDSKYGFTDETQQQWKTSSPMLTERIVRSVPEKIWLGMISGMPKERHIRNNISQLLYL